MEEDNNILQFGAADIERYHKGLMNPKEMHAMEKAAMDDPFLADALEGYQVPGVNIPLDLNELKNRLNERTGQVRLMAPVKKSPYYFLRIAAMIVVVAGAGLLAYTFLNKNGNENAVAKSEATTVVSADKNYRTDSVNLNRQVAVDRLADTFSGVKKIDGQKTDVVIASDSTSSAFINIDTGKIDLSVANTTRNAAVAPSENVGLVAPSKAPSNLDLKVQADDRKKQPPQAVLVEKKNDRAVASEELKLVKKETADKEVGDIEFRSQKQDNAFDKSRLAKAKNSPNYKLEEFAYKKDTTNYSRLNIFKGRVTDGFNNGIPFANVTISDVNVGTYADAKGYFNLVAPDTTLNVSLRAVGFNNSQIQLRNNLPTNEIVLQEDRSLNAIVMNTAKPNASRNRSSGMVLTEPEPSDGWENYDSYLANNLVVPEETVRQQKKGEVEVAFEVNSKGEPVNIKVTKSLCKECDEEAIRLIKEGPRWTRKSKKEKARVTVQF